MTGKNRIMIYGRKDIIKEPRYCRNVERSETKETSREEEIMKVVTGLFAAIAALSVISTFVEAADGCGRGLYYNGQRCVPQDGPGYGYGPPSRNYGPPAGYYEAPPRIDLGGRRNEPRYVPPNSAFKTPNNCPPNYTVQDGLCKPYTGR